MDKLKFSYLKLGHFPDFELRFLVVFPYIVAPSMNEGMLVYPAEISVTHYTFKRGTISCWSSLINFDPAFLDATGHLFHQITVEENAMVLGVPLMSAQGRSPSEVWRTLLTQYHKHGVVVCDADQMEIVDRALHFLASTFGPDQLRIHAEIMGKMITAQDFISALSKVYYDIIEKPLPDYLTDELIDLQFANAKEVNKDIARSTQSSTSRCSSSIQDTPPVFFCA